MKHITEARKLKDISQQRLAMLTDIPRSRIVDFENGYSEPTKEEIDKMSKAIMKYKGESK